MKNLSIRRLACLGSGVVLFFSYLMWRIVLPYTGWELDVEFLITKQHVIHLDYYKGAFYLHIFSSLIVIISSAFLFLPGILKSIPKVHKYIGRLYVFLVLLISAPSGLVMAFHSNGNFATSINFILLSILWWVFTFIGFQSAIKKKFIQHRNWMLRSFALTMSAVTLRLAQMILNTFFTIEPDLQYCLVSWGSWVINLIIVEMFIRRKFLFRTPKFNFSSSSM